MANGKEIGAGAGAAIGTVVPGVGTTVGAVVGGVVGGMIKGKGTPATQVQACIFSKVGGAPLYKARGDSRVYTREGKLLRSDDEVVSYLQSLNVNWAGVEATCRKTGENVLTKDLKRNWSLLVQEVESVPVPIATMEMTTQPAPPGGGMMKPEAIGKKEGIPRWLIYVGIAIVILLLLRR